MFAMYLKRIVFLCISILMFGHRLNADEGENSTESHKVSNINDNYSFVALIDVVFNDESKKTCTATIIHNNVVITVARCFVHKRSKWIKPELTTSFVVIGTKIMFDTDYEQYLPIERVITHPEFKDHCVDLALVFTFAGMTSDKPGNIVPLADVNVSTTVESEVTVLSWGQCHFDYYDELLRKGKSVDTYQPEEDYRYNDELVFGRQKTTLGENVNDNEYQGKPERGKRHRGTLLRQNNKKSKKRLRYPGMEQRSQAHKYYEGGRGRIPPVLRKNALRDSNTGYRRATSHHFSNTEHPKENKLKFRRYIKFRKSSTSDMDWRRKMGSEHQHNRHLNILQLDKLSIQQFRVISSDRCRKLLENEGLELNKILWDKNQLLCYTSEDGSIDSVI
ncbi:uncharacterized protein LOC126966968 [Leptidea sinapis]|uniref:uncharacterized protein LOC126966968 n=1 Tax=Leptidea sinapis TaxID=189913 RepID=UPI0021C32A07|nr:uncharacterized protein LOC126966968 [Leptidea sinapis]